MLPEVDYPDVGYAKLQVVVDSVPHACHCVFRRHDFDAELRWRGEFLLFGNRQFSDGDIGYPDSRAANAKPHV